MGTNSRQSSNRRRKRVREGDGGDTYFKYIKSMYKMS